MKTPQTGQERGRSERGSSGTIVQRRAQLRAYLSARATQNPTAARLLLEWGHQLGGGARG